jgi:hypothetical protein
MQNIEIYILVFLFILLFIYYQYNQTEIINDYDNNKLESMENISSMQKYNNDKTSEEITLDKIKNTKIMNKHLIYTKPIETSEFSNKSICDIINIHSDNNIRFNDTHKSIMISWFLNHQKFTNNNKEIFKYLDMNEKFMKMPLTSDEYEKVLINNQECDIIEKYDDRLNTNEKIKNIDNQVKRRYIFNHDYNSDIHKVYEYYMIVFCGNDNHNMFIENKVNNDNSRCKEKLTKLGYLMINECSSQIKLIDLGDLMKNNNINLYQFLKVTMIKKDDDMYIDNIESRPINNNKDQNVIDKLFVKFLSVL